MATRKAGKIYVGVGGWNFAPWRGSFYPKGLTQARELHYASRQLTAIEINSTFYGPATPKTAEAWVRRVETNPRFRFTAKLWRRFTHERETAFTADEVKLARAGFEVLAGAGRLGAVLLQFPWSFRNDVAAHEWLRDLFGAFADLPLVLEVRHASWSDPEVLAWLAERGVGLVNVDQPLFGNSIKPAAHAIGGRLREAARRNYRDWLETGRRATSATTTSTRPTSCPVERIRDIAARPHPPGLRRHQQPPRRQGRGHAEMIESMLPNPMSRRRPGSTRYQEVPSRRGADRGGGAARGTMAAEAPGPHRRAVWNPAARGVAPAIVEADDGRLYVAKFSGGAGTAALVAEIVAGLARRSVCASPSRHPRGRRGVWTHEGDPRSDLPRRAPG